MGWTCVAIAFTILLGGASASTLYELHGSGSQSAQNELQNVGQDHANRLRAQHRAHCAAFSMMPLAEQVLQAVFATWQVRHPPTIAENASSGFPTSVRVIPLLLSPPLCPGI